MRARARAADSELGICACAGYLYVLLLRGVLIGARLSSSLRWVVPVLLDTRSRVGSCTVAGLDLVDLVGE